MFEKLLKYRFARYFMLGCIAVLTQYTVLIAAIEVLKIAEVLSALIAFTIAVLTNYFLQHRYTFNSDVQHSKAVPRFFAIAAITGVTNVILFSFLVDHIHYFFAQAIASLVIFAINYELNKRLTF